MTDKAEEALYEYEQRDEEESEVYQRKRRKCICMCLPKRYLVAILSFFGGINAYSLRVTLSVGMVAMVSNTTEKVYVNGTEIVHVIVSKLYNNYVLPFYNIMHERVNNCVYCSHFLPRLSESLVTRLGPQAQSSPKWCLNQQSSDSYVTPLTLLYLMLKNGQINLKNLAL